MPWATSQQHAAVATGHNRSQSQYRCGNIAAVRLNGARGPGDLTIRTKLAGHPSGTQCSTRAARGATWNPHQVAPRAKGAKWEGAR